MRHVEAQIRGYVHDCKSVISLPAAALVRFDCFSKQVVVVVVCTDLPLVRGFYTPLLGEIFMLYNTLLLFFVLSHGHALIDCYDLGRSLAMKIPRLAVTIRELLVIAKSSSIVFALRLSTAVIFRSFARFVSVTFV